MIESKFTISDFNNFFSKCYSCGDKKQIKFAEVSYASHPAIFYFIDSNGFFNLNIKNKYKKENKLIIDPVHHNYFTNIIDIENLINKDNNIFIEISCKNCNYYINSSNLQFNNNKILPIKVHALYLTIRDMNIKKISYSLNYFCLNDKEKWNFSIWQNKEKIEECILTKNFEHFDLLKYNKEKLLNKFQLYLTMM